MVNTDRYWYPDTFAKNPKIIIFICKILLLSLAM